LTSVGPAVIIAGDVEPETIPELGEKARGGRGCFAALTAAAAVVVIAVVAGVVWLARGAGDPNRVEHRLLAVLRGEGNAEEFVTEVIVRRMADEAGVPPAEADRLEREMAPLSRDLPYMSEGEKHKLAMMIRHSIEDGRVTDEELRMIRDYGYRAARDGDAKP
jgi:hypothetical protein